MPVSRSENDDGQNDLGTNAVPGIRTSSAAPASSPAPQAQRTSTIEPRLDSHPISHNSRPDLLTSQPVESAVNRALLQDSSSTEIYRRRAAATAVSFSERTPIVRHTRRLPVVGSVQGVSTRTQAEEEGRQRVGGGGEGVREGREEQENHAASTTATRLSSRPTGTTSLPRPLPGRNGDTTASESRESTRFPLLDSSRWLQRQRLAGNEDIRTRLQARAIFTRWNLDSSQRTRSSSPRIATGGGGEQRQASRSLHRESQAELVREGTTTDAGRTRSDRATPAQARDRRLSSPSQPPSQQPNFAPRTHWSRMEPRDHNSVPPPSSSSVHDYAGWAPGTIASENPRPTLNSLYAMAGRSAASALTARDPPTSVPSASSLTSLERRYNSERQRQLDIIEDYRRNNGQLQSPYYPPPEPRRYSGSGVGGGGGVGSSSNSIGIGPLGGGFASTVVDSDGNPIDTGISNELPNPRSIVYNPPPSTRGVRPSQSAAHAVGPARSRERVDTLDDADLVERYLASSSNVDIPASEDSAWARYTELQRQEHVEGRRQRAQARLDQRNDQRLERLRRAGASTSNGPRYTPVWTGDRNYPLGEIRRDLHELHRDRHPALSQPNSSFEAARDGMKRAIQYLHRIRTVAGECETQCERMQAAREEGFGPGASGTEALDRSDLVTDLSQLGPLSETSWLVPGTVFTGSQRAINVSTITNALGHSPLHYPTPHHSANYTATQRERYSRLAEISSYPRRLSPMLLEQSRRGPAADPSNHTLIDSVIRRYRPTDTGPAEQSWNSPTSRTRLTPDPTSLPTVEYMNSAASNNSSAAAAFEQLRQGTSGAGLRSQVSEAATSEPRLKQVEGEDTWPVKVRITSVDYTSMKLTGTMEAMNVPNRSNSGAGSGAAANPPTSARAGASSHPESNQANSNEQRRSSGEARNGSGAGKEETEGSQGGTGRNGRSTSNGGDDNGGDDDDDDDEEEENKNTITTFLEGEILDLQRFSLETGGYRADSSIDGTYWRRLEPFRSLKDEEVVAKVLSLKWLKETVGKEYLLMRWKEKCFVDPSHANQGLTISGFYYISLHRPTGRIEGLYYDPQSSPYQHLCLAPAIRHFSSYSFC